MIAKAIATGFGSGLSPVAPGTVGSMAGLVIWMVLRYLTVNPVIIALITIVVGHLAVATYTKHTTQSDPQEIVIDEWAGLFITLSLIEHTSISMVLFGFLLFRVFDIKKPLFIRKAEQLSGATGIMADDILAGFCSLAILQLCEYFVSYLT